MRFMKFLGLAVLTLVMGQAASASTLSDVKARGVLKCGVNTGLAGFALKNAQGQWAGFDVDFCKAVAAAVLGDANKVEYVPLSASERFDKLKAGDIDLLSRNSTWTMERETKLPLRFVGVSYMDGVGFMVPKALGVNSAVNLNQAAICVVSGTTAVTVVQDFFTEKGMVLSPVISASTDEMLAAYEAGKCDAMSTDQSQLYAFKVRLKKADDSVVLADVISKEPLGPVVRQGDDQWFGIIRWVLFGLIDAEELDVKASGVDVLKSDSKSPAVQRLLGKSGSYGTDLGLDAEWMARALKAVGNYGEIFERNLGAGSPLAINRGINALWSDGGLLYVPSVR